VLMMRKPQPVEQAPVVAVAPATTTTAAGQADAQPTSPDRAELEKWRAQAQSLWFNDGSCTGGKSE
ncbi:MAG: hypothetical protein ACO3BZ_04980, partial [Burkholderiaceae bacterium]